MSEIERLQRLAGIMPKTLSLQEDGEPDTGDTVTKTVVGHVDDEPDMIRQELYKMGKYCIDLYRMLGEVPNGDLPECGLLRLQRRQITSVQPNTIWKQSYMHLKMLL